MSTEKTKETPSANKSYWLSNEVSAWIEKESKKDDRSASNFLDRLIRKEMERDKRKRK